jgi:ferritin-like metal-binding protein YciE
MAMSADTLRGTFVYHLEETYYVENRLADVLEQVATETANEDLRDAIEDHREQTRTHVERLEGVFDAIDEPPEQRPSPTFDALLEERTALLERTGGDEHVRDLHNLGMAVKTEYLEVASYENLVVLARKLGLSRDVLDALEDSLRDERAMKNELRPMTEDSPAWAFFGRITG